MAWNQVASDNLVEWKSVPDVRVVCLLQLAHCQPGLPCKRNDAACVEPHWGQTNPDGQHTCVSAATHWAFVP